MCLMSRFEGFSRSPMARQPMQEVSQGGAIRGVNARMVRRQSQDLRLAFLGGLPEANTQRRLRPTLTLPLHVVALKFCVSCCR
jgi:hypothetical protein